jgi:hypothetical protein
VIAHIGGIPVEETIGALGPALLITVGAAFRVTRSWVRRRYVDATALAQRRPAA